MKDGPGKDGGNTYIGNTPKCGFFDMFGFGGEVCGTTWTVYVLDEPIRDGQWLRVKVAADEPVRHKANYYTAWNGTRLSNSRDKRLMACNRLALETVLVETLKKRNPHHTLRILKESANATRCADKAEENPCESLQGLREALHGGEGNEHLLQPGLYIEVSHAKDAP